jgi:phosphopantetheinyl transferase
LRIRSNRDKVMIADCEALSSDGQVLMFLEGLTDRELPISRPLHRLMLEPVEQDFAEVMDLPVPLPGGGRALLAVVEGFPAAVLQGSFGVWRHALAFLALSPPERREWRERKLPLPREIDWLLGRAAAKDAVRRLLQERTGQRLAMTDIRLETEPGGRPVVAGGWKCDLPARPAISIAHTEGLAAAVCGARGRLGLDVEKVQPPSQDFLDGGFSAAEIACLPAGSPEERAEWILRAWCAKEAVGKALGSGVPRNPRELAVTSCDPAGGTMVLIARGAMLREAGAGDGESLTAMTFRRDSYVFGIARLP